MYYDWGSWYYSWKIMIPIHYHVLSWFLMVSQPTEFWSSINCRMEHLHSRLLHPFEDSLDPADVAHLGLGRWVISHLNIDGQTEVKHDEILMKYSWNTDEILMIFFIRDMTTKLGLHLTCGRPGSRIVQWHGDSSLSLWQLRWPKGRMCRSWPPHSTNSNGVVP